MAKTPSLPTLIDGLGKLPEAIHAQTGQLIEATDKERELVRILVEEPATEELKDAESGQLRTVPLRRAAQWEKAAERAGFGTGASASRAARRHFKRPAVLTLYLEHCQELLRSGQHLAYQRLLSIIESSRSERAAIEAIRLLTELLAVAPQPEGGRAKARFGVTIVLAGPAAEPRVLGSTIEGERDDG